MRRDTLFQKIQECENCGEFNQIDHMYCTSCGESLHTTCRECQCKYSKSYSYCPNCGAPNQITSLGKCEYCGSTITTGKYVWILSNIERKN